MIRSFALASAMWLVAIPSAAQDDPRVFAGAIAGVSALSGDARSVTSGSDAALSLYDAKNGAALNVFAGVDVAQYFSVQGNWMWNRNDVTLVSSFAGPQAGGYYEQRRRSRQHAVVLDALIYFRRRDSPIRPYLGTGISLVHFASDVVETPSARSLTPPLGAIESTRAGLRSHVGIDARLSNRLTFRYSFSETISGNPIGPSLTPPGRRAMMNFQNLFGLFARF